MIKTKVCIIGAGAGGMGAAYRLIKNGVDTVVVDRYPDFGGTAVFCGVDGWEPGPSLDGLHTLLYEEMNKKGGCHVVEQVPNCNLFTPDNGNNWDNHSFSERPWGLSLKSECTYEDTLKNAKFRYAKRLQFEPMAMREATDAVFSPYKEHLTTLFGYEYTSNEHADGRIISVTVKHENSSEEIFADYFIDATGDGAFARDAGCAFTLGSEGKEDYDEPSAGQKRRSVNGASYIFRIAKTNSPLHTDSIPSEYRDIDLGEWEKVNMKKTVSCFVEYPNGDINVNMLPTMQGMEYLDLGESADLIGRARVWRYWSFLQKERNMQGYTLTHIYDAGVRESYRIVGKYVLREQDLRAGAPTLPTMGRTIAIADHIMDVHGENAMASELEKPYEIPLECTMTNEFENLFVASKASSFTHIAASSARLTRTIISMGEGVGEYIAELLK